MHGFLAMHRIQMLDALRYMLVWNPLLLVGAHVAVCMSWHDNLS